MNDDGITVSDPTMPDPIDPPRIRDDGTPTYIGPYRIDRRLARHGQADVFEARDLTLQRGVVIKWYRCRDDKAAKIVDEGQVLAAVNHPNVVKVIEANVHDGRPYLVLDLIKGQPLDKHVGGAPMDWREAVALMEPICGAIEAVHRVGGRHYDLKPQNVMIDGQTQQPVVIDFGLGRYDHPWQSETDRHNVGGGSLPYMAPEQAAGDRQQYGVRTDVFLLGATLYHLLTGHAPYRGTSEAQVRADAQSGDFDRESLARSSAPRWLKAICRKAMSREPKNRFAGAESMRRAMRSGLNRRAMFQCGVALAAAGAMIVGTGPWWLPMWRGMSASASQALNADAMLSLNVVVLRNRGRIEVPLDKAEPVHTGEVLRIRASTPPRWRARLYHVDSTGEAHRRELTPTGAPPDVADAAKQTLIYPLADAAAQLDEPSGAEMYVLVAAEQGVSWDDETIRLRLRKTVGHAVADLRNSEQTTLVYYDGREWQPLRRTRITREVKLDPSVVAMSHLIQSLADEWRSKGLSTRVVVFTHQPVAGADP